MGFFVRFKVGCEQSLSEMGWKTLRLLITNIIRNISSQNCENWWIFDGII